MMLQEPVLGLLALHWGLLKLLGHHWVVGARSAAAEACSGGAAQQNALGLAWDCCGVVLAPALGLL